MKFVIVVTIALCCLALNVSLQNTPYQNSHRQRHQFADYTDNKYYRHLTNPVLGYTDYSERHYAQSKPKHANVPNNFDSRINFEQDANIPASSNQKHSDPSQNSDNSKPSSNAYVPLTKNLNPNPTVNLRNGPKDDVEVYREIPSLLSQSITELGINLIGRLDSSKGENKIISPYSIATVLALLQQGASGSTLEEITRVVGLEPNLAAANYKAMNDDLITRTSGPNVLKSANNIFMANSFDLNGDFKRRAKNIFGSDITPLSFDNPGVAVKTINDWVAKETDTKIDKLVSQDTISAATQLVLANAVYFKGVWDRMFRKQSTLPREFYLRKDHVKEVPMMRMRHLFRGGVDKDTGVQIAILPFKNMEYSLFVLLPPPVGIDLNKLHDTLKNGKLASYQNLPYEDTQMELPKFTIKADTNLLPLLQNMGISKIFNPQAELWGLGTHRNRSPQVSSAVHTAMMTIDEEGATAAAATSFAAVALSYEEPSMFFSANRPFLAVIWDHKLSMPVFIAKIEDPSQ